jgi:hypothetical protein
VVSAVSPVSVYEFVVGVPTDVYVPPEVKLRYTVYPVAPVTAVQLTVILVDEAAVAVTPAGALGAVPPPLPEIVMDNSLVALPAELVALTVKVDVPAVVGVPVISPVAARIKPAGNVPLSRLHTMVPVPVAASFAVYAVPTVPPINDVVMIVGAPPGALIVMDNDLVSVPISLVAFTVKVDFPAVVGVPEITPAVVRLKPAGNAPSRLHVMGVSPLAASFLLYATPTVPPANDPVVILGEPSAVSSSRKSHPAIENPITATKAIKPNNLIVFFIFQLLLKLLIKINISALDEHPYLFTVISLSSLTFLISHSSFLIPP